MNVFCFVVGVGLVCVVRVTGFFFCLFVCLHLTILLALQNLHVFCWAVGCSMDFYSVHAL